MLSGAELLGDNSKIQGLTFRSKSRRWNNFNTHTLVTYMLHDLLHCVGPVVKCTISKGIDPLYLTDKC